MSQQLLISQEKGMKIKFVAFLVLMMFVLSPVMASENEKRSKSDFSTFTFSIFYPFSTNKSKYHRTKINLSLFYGYVGWVEGLDLAIFASRVKENIRGIQLTGLAGVAGNSLSGIQASAICNVVGNELRGLQVAGIANVAGDKVRGIQASGIFNVTGERLTGIQASGIFNVTGESFKGVQSAGIINITGESFKGIQSAGILNITGQDLNGLQGSGIANIVGERFSGLQASGIGNVVGDDLEGLQASGIANVVGGDNLGLQFSLVNISGYLSGVQCGLVNVTGEAKGVQIGLVNYTKKEMTGLPIGVVNIAKNGIIRGVTWGSNIMALNMGVKFCIRNIYSILYAGTFNIDENIQQCLAYGFQYGYHFPLKNKFFIETDLGAMNIDNKTLFNTSKGERDQYIFKARAMLGIEIWENLSFFAGIGLTYKLYHYQEFSNGKYEPLFIAGLELF
jgi:hypothetical protein